MNHNQLTLIQLWNVHEWPESNCMMFAVWRADRDSAEYGTKHKAPSTVSTTPRTEQNLLGRTIDHRSSANPPKSRTRRWPSPKAMKRLRLGIFIVTRWRPKPHPEGRLGCLEPELCEILTGGHTYGVVWASSYFWAFFDLFHFLCGAFPFWTSFREQL